MNYYQGQQLIKAGFPRIKMLPTLEYNEKKTKRVASYSVSLEDLIDACGEDLFELSQLSKSTGHKKDVWVACNPGRCFQVKGNTIKEAVFNLYIKNYEAKLYLFNAIKTDSINR